MSCLAAAPEIPLFPGTVDPTWRLLLLIIFLPCCVLQAPAHSPIPVLRHAGLEPCPSYETTASSPTGSPQNSHCRDFSTWCVSVFSKDTDLPPSHLHFSMINGRLSPQILTYPCARRSIYSHSLGSAQPIFVPTDSKKGGIRPTESDPGVRCSPPRKCHPGEHHRLAGTGRALRVGSGGRCYRCSQCMMGKQESDFLCHLLPT